jgi:hypothetical protein
MKRTNFIHVAFVALTILVAPSCKKDPAPAADSRNVKYEITGNATGTFDVQYITGSNSGANATPTSLPWTKEIVAQAGVFAATMNASVFGAAPGTTITAKIYVGGVVKKEQTETVQANGVAIIASLQYVLN